MNASSRAWARALVIAVIIGQIVDKTTGQPLTDVAVSAEAAAKVPAARSNAEGRYTLRGLAPGRHTLTLSSDDVPAQSFEIVVKTGKPQHVDLTACSTTLDYSCAAAMP